MKHSKVLCYSCCLNSSRKSKRLNITQNTVIRLLWEVLERNVLRRWGSVMLWASSRRSISAESATVCSNHGQSGQQNRNRMVVDYRRVSPHRRLRRNWAVSSRRSRQCELNSRQLKTRRRKIWKLDKIMFRILKTVLLGLDIKSHHRRRRDKTVGFCRVGDAN